MVHRHLPRVGRTPTGSNSLVGWSVVAIAVDDDDNDDEEEDDDEDDDDDDDDVENKGRMKMYEALWTTTQLHMPVTSWHSLGRSRDASWGSLSGTASLDKYCLPAAPTVPDGADGSAPTGPAAEPAAPNW